MQCYYKGLYFPILYFNDHFYTTYIVTYFTLEQKLFFTYPYSVIFSIMFQYRQQVPSPPTIYFRPLRTCPLRVFFLIIFFTFSLSIFDFSFSICSLLCILSASFVIMIFFQCILQSIQSIFQSTAIARFFQKRGIPLIICIASY